MESFGLGGNFLAKVVQLQKWSSLTGQSSPTKNLPFHFQKFLLPVLLCYKVVIKVLVRTAMDHFDLIGSLVSIEQYHSIFS